MGAYSVDLDHTEHLGTSGRPHGCPKPRQQTTASGSAPARRQPGPPQHTQGAHIMHGITVDSHTSIQIEELSLQSVTVIRHRMTNATHQRRSGPERGRFQPQLTHETKIWSSRSPPRSAIAQTARHLSVDITDTMPAHTAAALRPDPHHTHGLHTTISG